VQKIFVSYRREDSIDVAGRIYDWLAARLPEDNVFIDVDSILAGADFRESLDKTLDQTGVVLAVIGRRWLEITDSSGGRRLDNPEDFVRIEIETAMQRKVPVMPILVQGAEMPSAQQLPESLAPFAYRQALHVRPNPDFNTDMGRVARALESYVPDIAVAADPIPGRGPTVTRGAPLPVTQAPLVVAKQKAPPVVPISSIHYPWMARRLLYLHIAAAFGFIPLILVAYSDSGTCTDTLVSCPGGAFIFIGVPFWATAVVLFLSMLGYTLTTLWKQKRWVWFGWVLVSLGVVLGLYPLLGLWSFSLFGPTTPALKKPQSLPGKG
jgi:hypothetical protein